MSFRYALIAPVLIALAGVTAAVAQVTTGTILGTVSDSSGAAVAGAQITITEVNKGTTQQLTSDESGAYSAPYLIPGTYRVSVEKSGFKREPPRPLCSKWTRKLA